MAWEKTDRDSVDAVARQNPWVEGEHVPQNPPFRRALHGRLLEELLKPSLRRFELILGSRRVGKTTLMYQLVADLIAGGIAPHRVFWMRLDHPMLVDQSLGVWMEILLGVAKSYTSSPATAENPLFVFLDEILYAKDWASWLKTFYDDHWPVRIVATGSATAALRQEHRDSGVGRWREWFLSPLLFHDFLRIQGTAIDTGPGSSNSLHNWQPPQCPLSEGDLTAKLQQFVMLGGFPELAVQAQPALTDTEVFKSQQVLREYAIERAIYKDLTQAYGIQNPLALEKLLYALAGQMGSILRSENLGSVASLSQPTVDAYMKYLEDAGLIMLLQNYRRSEESIQRRGRKVFFADSALRNAALQRGTAPLRNPAELGLLYENAVADHLEAYCRALQIRLFHWRDGKEEVDFVIGHPTAPVAVEVTGAQNHSPAGLRKLFSKYPEFNGCGWLLSPTAVGQDPVPSKDECQPGTAPLAAWLLKCGLAADAALSTRT